MDSDIQIVKGNALRPEQKQVVIHWNNLFFGNVSVSGSKELAPVHWRLILSESGSILSQVAITELDVDINGERLTVGSIGGLFTPTELQGKGYANHLMDRAEGFISTDLGYKIGILFCLPKLVPFYQKRNWTPVCIPVTLQQKNCITTWGAEVMLFGISEDSIKSVHVPRQSNIQENKSQQTNR